MNMHSRTLNLKEAADYLKIHYVTLSEKASRGEVPGAKAGRSWVFLEIDLIEYIRSKYVMRACVSDNTKGNICHSTNAKTRQTGGLKLPSMETQYMKALGLATKSKPKSSMTS